MNGKTRDFYHEHPRFNEKTRHSHKRLSENTIKNALNDQLDSGTPCHKLQRISTKSHKYEQGMQKIHTKHEIGDSWEQKWTEKHETFVMQIHLCTRKHDIPIRRQSEKTIKVITKVTSSSENYVKMYTKNPPRHQIQGAAQGRRPTTKREPWACALTGKNACKSNLIFRKPRKNAYKKIRRGFKFRVRSKAEGLPDTWLIHEPGKGHTMLTSKLPKAFQSFRKPSKSLPYLWKTGLMT